MPNELTYVTCNHCGTNFQVSVPQNNDYVMAKLDDVLDESFDTVCPKCKKELYICIKFVEEEDE